MREEQARIREAERWTLDTFQLERTEETQTSQNLGP